MQGGSTATIEYAMAVLKVPHIIVGGHTDCTVMKAVLHPEDVHDLPAVKKVDLHGWVYSILTGDIWVYDFASERFTSLLDKNSQRLKTVH